MLQILPRAEFWSTLIDCWEARPFDRPDGAMTVFNPTTVFDAVRNACRRLPPSVSVYRDGKSLEVVADRLPYLPLEDSSLETYDERLSRLIGDGEVMIRVGHLQRHHARLWQSVRRFLAPLEKTVGYCNHQVTTGVFMGRYRRTPFGVHLDNQSALTFPIHGTKRFRTWPDSYVRNDPPGDDNTGWAQKHRGSSLVLEARPGGLMYWPSREWHVGESEDGFVATFNISFWYVDSAADLLKTVAISAHEYLAASGFEDRLALPQEFPERPEPPEALLESAAALGAVLERAVRRDWLRRRSASGFLHVPPALSRRPLADADRLRGDPSLPILSAPLGDDLGVAANGHVLELPARPAVSALLAQLNADVELTVSEAVRVLRQDFSADAALALLASLVAIRGLTVAPAEDGL
jgi:Cupin superfamily protein